MPITTATPISDEELAELKQTVEEQPRFTIWAEDIAPLIARIEDDAADYQVYLRRQRAAQELYQALNAPGLGQLVGFDHLDKWLTLAAKAAGK